MVLKLERQDPEAIELVKRGFALQHQLNSLAAEATEQYGATDEGSTWMRDQLMAQFSEDDLYQLLHHLAWYGASLQAMLEAVGACLLLKREVNSNG